MNGIKTILIVSPYLSVLKASEEALQAAGYGVICTHKVSDGLLQLFSRPIDAIVLCSSLKPQQRRLMLEQVRKRWNLPILFLSPGRPDSVEQLLRTLTSQDRDIEAA